MLEGLGLVVISLLLLNGLMYLQQPSMTFFPTPTLDASPHEQGLEYQDVQAVTADDLRLRGWCIPARDAQGVVLFMHGNAGNRSHRGESIEIFHRLGQDVYIFDYRGYADSEGKPDEQGLYEDARAMWRSLVDERGIDAQDIVIFGRSLGGVVATKLASETDPGGLILESTFSSARDMADALFPVLSRLVVLRYRFDTLSAVSQVHAPVLVLHSHDDEIVPFELGRKVYQAANPPREFVELRGSHNSGFLQSQPGYERTLGAFFQRVNSR